MNKRFGRTLCCAALLMGGVFSAQAQALKVGYVDTQKVINESIPGKAAQSRLQEEFSKRQKSLLDMEGALSAAAASLDKDAPQLSEAERARRGRELADQGRSLERAKREFEGDLEYRRSQEHDALKERVERAIKVVAQERKIDMVFVEHVAFARASIDISSIVIEAVNAQR